MRIIGGIPKKRQMIFFLLFIIPSLIFAIISYYYPFGTAIKLAFSKYDAISPPKFTGFKNFVKMFKDKVFWISLKNTFLYALYVVPFTLIISFLVAVGLNMKSRIVFFLRVFYFLPMVTSSVAIALVWRWIYNPDYGILNQILSLFHIPHIKWLVNSQTALISLAILGVWGGIGYNTILFLAGLQNIPRVYYEAAKIDGASDTQILFRITIPLMTPTIFFVLVMLIISSVQIFDSVFILTNGGPGYSTYTLVYYIYRNGFYWFRMGYGMAISWFLFSIILILTAIQFGIQKRWVYYES